MSPLLRTMPDFVRDWFARAPGWLAGAGRIA